MTPSKAKTKGTNKKINIKIISDPIMESLIKRIMKYLTEMTMNFVCQIIIIDKINMIKITIELNNKEIKCQNKMK